MGSECRGLPSLLLVAAVVACIVSVALSLAIPQDVVRSRRSSNSSAPPAAPTDSSGRPLPPPDGYAHGKGKRAATAVTEEYYQTSASESQRHSSDVEGASRDKRSSEGDEYAAPGDVGRSRRASNDSAPPRGPPPSRGRREAAGGERQKQEYRDLQETETLTRERRSSNSSGRPSGPPKGPPPSRVRRHLDSPEAGVESEQWQHQGDHQLEETETLTRERRESNSSGRPSGPPKGAPPSRGRRHLDSRGTGGESGQSENKEDRQLEETETLARERRASNSSGRPSGPPKGPPPSRGRRHLDSQEEGGESGQNQRDRETDETETLVRERRASNSSGRPSGPPKGPPPSRGRRHLDSQEEGAPGYGSGSDADVDGTQVVTRERRASSGNHTGPPRGPPPSRGRRELEPQGAGDAEMTPLVRERRNTTSDSSSDYEDDDDDEDDDSGPPQGPPPRGRGPPGRSRHGMHPPRGCGGRRPPTDSGTNSTSTDDSTETVERLSTRRGRNRGR